VLASDVMLIRDDARQTEIIHASVAEGWPRTKCNTHRARTWPARRARPPTTAPRSVFFNNLVTLDDLQNFLVALRTTPLLPPPWPRHAAVCKIAHAQTPLLQMTSVIRTSASLRVILKIERDFPTPGVVERGENFLAASAISSWQV